MGECLSRTIEIYRRDALQSDGNSDGKSVPLSSRRSFTVRAIFGLTVNLECDVQHPCGFPGDRRLGHADGKFARSQAIGHSGASRFVVPRGARGWKGGGRDYLPVVDLWNYIINGSLFDSRSTRGSRQRPTFATIHSRVVRSPRPLGIECTQCVGQLPHGRARYRAAPGHQESLATGCFRASHRVHPV